MTFWASVSAAVVTVVAVVVVVAVVDVVAVVVVDVQTPAKLFRANFAFSFFTRNRHSEKWD